MVVNEVYGPFFSVERSDLLLPEAAEPSSSWSVIGIMRNILDIRDAYYTEAGDAIRMDEIEISGIVELVENSI